MGKYIIKRFLSAIPVMLTILVVVFTLMRIVPGNPMYNISADNDLSQEDLIELQERFGLNGSIFDQLYRYITNILKGDWGESFYNGKPVFENIFAKFEPTVIITLVSSCITIFCGIPLGVYCATHHNSKLDYFISSTSIIINCIPGFAFGILLYYVFCFKLQLFPMFGYKFMTPAAIEKLGFWTALGRSLKYAFMPSLAIGLSGMPGYIRHTRSQMLDVLESDYIRTARAKGLSNNRVNYIHALRNVLSYMITMVSGTVIGHLGGSTIQEGIFGIPGVGRFAFESLSSKDYIQEQAILLFFSGISVFMNIVLDIIYKALDPRVELD